MAGTPTSRWPGSGWPWGIWTGWRNSEPILHFGLGDDALIQRLTVSWPSGLIQTFTNLSPDRKFTIAEPATPAPILAPPKAPAAVEHEAADTIEHAVAPVEPIIEVLAPPVVEIVDTVAGAIENPALRQGYRRGIDELTAARR